MIQVPDWEHNGDRRPETVPVRDRQVKVDIHGANAFEGHKDDAQNTKTRTRHVEDCRGGYCPSAYPRLAFDRGNALTSNRRGRLDYASNRVDVSTRTSTGSHGRD